MKTFLLLLLLACTTMACAQKSLDGFMGIKFGSSPQSVRTAMTDKNGCTLDTENSPPGMMFYRGCSFAGRKAIVIAFKFVNNKFYTAIVIVKADLDTRTIKVYEDIRDEINEKYFKTDRTYENYKSPYQKEDGYTETAIKLGKATFSSYWHFPTSGRDNTISLEIENNMSIYLTYQDGNLVLEALAKTKAIDSKDY